LFLTATKPGPEDLCVGLKVSEAAKTSPLGSRRMPAGGWKGKEKMRVGTRTGTQGLAHARQGLYHLSHTPSALGAGSWNSRIRPRARV
jgi:hypothetical protein